MERADTATGGIITYQIPDEEDDRDRMTTDTVIYSSPYWRQCVASVSLSTLSLSRFVTAIMLPSDYLMEFLVDDEQKKLNMRRLGGDVEGDAVAVNGTERQWSTVLPPVPPTNHLSAARYCLQDARRHQTLLPIAAVYRCCCCCCC